MAAHGDETQVHEDRFGAATGIHARAHVEDAGVGHVDHRQAGLDQLEEHDGAEDLGVGLGDRAGETRRRGRPAQAERVDAHRHAPGGQQEAGVEHLGFVLQRRHRAVDDREERPLRVPASVVGGRREHVHHKGDLRGALHLVLHVLAGVFEQQRERLEGLAAGRGVVGAHRRPHEADLVEGVGDTSRSGDVGGRRRPSLARAVVERRRAGAVEREPGAGAVEHDVAGRVAGGEQHLARRPCHGPLDQLPRQAGDQGLVVDLGAGVAQHGECPGAGKAHAGTRQHVERRLVDLVARGGVEQAQAGDHGAPFVAAPYGTITRRAPGTM